MKLKHLLALAILLIGVSNAWAEATVIYERGTTGHEWTEADLSEWVLSGDNASSSITNGVLKFAKTVQSRSEYTYTKSITTTDDYLVNIQVLWGTGTANGSSTAGCYMQVGDVKFFWCGLDRYMDVTVGGVTTRKLNSLATTMRGQDWFIDLTINKKTKSVSYSLSCANYNSGTPVDGNGTSQTGVVESVLFGWSRGGQQNISDQSVKTILITEEESFVPSADYTINYKFDGSTIKSDNGNTAVGETVNAVSPITIGGQKYYATSGTSMTIDADAANNILNVDLRKANVYTYSVKNSFDEVLLAATEGIEGETYAVAYPKYVLSGTDLYLAESSTGEKSFSKYITLTENTEAVVNYTKRLENIVYFSEAEDVEGATVYNSCSNTSTFASGDLAVFSNLAHLTTLTAGYYKFFARTLGRTDRYFDFYNGNGEDKVSLFHPGSAGFYNCGEQVSGTIILNSSTDIYFQGGYGTTSNNGNVVDLFYIQKVGDALTANTDATFLINNPNIDGNANGWTCERPNGGNGPTQAATNNNNFEYWCNDTKNPEVRENGSFDYYQTINNLPNGYYTISAEMYNSLNGETGAVFNESCGVYGTSSVDNAMAYVTVEGNTLNRYTTNPILVTDGTLRLGVKSDKRMGARWFVADNFRLTYLGDASANMTVAADRYATFCAPFDVTLPSGVVAYMAAMNQENTSVVLTDPNLTGNVLPAGTAVILKNENGTDVNETFYDMATFAGATCQTQSLVGMLTDTSISAGAYVLQTQGGVQKFFRVAANGYGDANRCYLVANTGARVITFDGDETAIETVKTSANEVVFDLAGRKVLNAQKGLYIVNGKKVIR